MIFGTHIYKVSFNNHAIGRQPFMNKDSLLLLFVKHHYKTASVTSNNSTIIKEPSFAASYLVNTFGFSSQSALSLSKYLKFKNSDIPNSVLTCFRDYGFSETQLSRFVSRCPRLLSFNAEKNIAPKFEFFLSKGVSRDELVRVFSSYPVILTRSLDKYMVPLFDFYRSMLKSDESVSRVFVRCPRFILYPDDRVKANIKHLRDNGVPESKVAVLIRYWPTTVGVKIERFNEIVGFVKEKGLIRPSNVSFVIAIASVAAISSSTWEKKFVKYERWGWSKEDFLTAFQKHPQFMMVSESKSDAVMNFMINEIGCEPSFIAQHPMFLSFSLQRRTIPRCSVIKVLSAKGLVKLTCLSTMLNISDDLFEKKLVTNYEEEAPYLLKLYKEKIDHYSQT
ncbi:hypothetical protein ACFE04_012988 [Oxalis oulophora]